MVNFYSMDTISAKSYVKRMASMYGGRRKKTLDTFRNNYF